MRVCIATEQRFASTPDGAIWATPASSANQFWQRYLDVFDSVAVFARVAPVDRARETWRRADGNGIRIVSLPNYLGPYQYLRVGWKIPGLVRAAVRPDDALLFRVPSQTAACFGSVLGGGRPYGLEVVGDPQAVFARGVVDTPLRPLFRWWFASRLRKQCAGACAVAYVTRNYLQGQYPAAPGAFVTNYSSIDLPETEFVCNARTVSAFSRPPLLVSIGSFDQLYKGFDVLVEALAIARRQGTAVRLVLIGEGRFRRAIHQLAVDLAVADLVEFRGFLPDRGQLWSELDAADLFVLASRTEGLPRAMIEAMARALPCIGSAVGGISELLAPEDLIPVGNAAALASAILAVLNDAERAAQMSARNLATAMEFGASALRARRRHCLERLRARTAEWLRRKPSPVLACDTVLVDPGTVTDANPQQNP